MLNRQKSLICLLHYAGGKATRLKVVKWSFLLEKETDFVDKSPFYDFFPFRYGPYSFSLKHEVGKMVKDGWISRIDDWSWGLNEKSSEVLKDFSSKIHRTAKEIINKYGRLDEEKLLSTVYGGYPWYTIKSELVKKQELPLAPNAVYTVGYEGISVDRFLDNLLRNGIRSVLDVRKNPVARRFGFHKKTLSRICESLGIVYRHIPELGIQSFLRSDLKKKSDYEKLLLFYEKEILPGKEKELLMISQKIQERPTVIMCMEADAEICHRSKVASVVSCMTSLPVRHL